MATKKIAKRTTKPTIEQEVAGLTISTNLMKRELVDLSPKISRLGSGLDSMRSGFETMQRKVEKALADQDDRIDREPPQINQEQLNQLAMAVNKIAAYAAAMDETKKTMIKLTSARIDRLDARVARLRVRLKRLKG